MERNLAKEMYQAHLQIMADPAYVNVRKHDWLSGFESAMTVVRAFADSCSQEAEYETGESAYWNVMAFCRWNDC
jgi:hypothetical protein